MSIGIPHHLAYSLGNRGKNWDTHDESFSPVAEIFSHHGSSERDATSIPMERHIHMGPRVDGTSVVAGLKRGKHFGLICSGDNHEVPAMVKYGRAGVWADDYSKDAIWDALTSRRTFGFTGSRIDVWTEAEGHPLGSVFTTDAEEVELKVRAHANSKVERIELYRDGDLDDVHVVRWRAPEPSEDGTVRFKFRVEFGWGPNVKYFPEATEGPGRARSPRRARWSPWSRSSAASTTVTRSWTRRASALLPSRRRSAERTGCATAPCAPRATSSRSRRRSTAP